MQNRTTEQQEEQRSKIKARIERISVEQYKLMSNRNKRLRQHLMQQEGVSNLK